MNSTPIIKSWKSQGHYFNFEGNEIFYIDAGDRSNEVILILHGYPSCSYDYKEILPVLTQNYRVVIVDFLGFGLSDKPLDNEYLLTTQADVVEACCKELKIIDFHLVAHDYGTSVATELIYRDNNSLLKVHLNTVTLCNGSMLIDMSQLRPIQKLLKHPLTGPIIAWLSNKNTFHKNMKNIWHDPFKYDQENMQPIWDMLTINGGKKVLPKITRYINQRYQNYARWIGALHKTKLPIHILWAAEDPVAVVAMANKLEGIIPNSTKTIIEKCGHYPMIEKSTNWCDLLLNWIKNNN